jgi:hypothetical protein
MKSSVILFTVFLFIAVASMGLTGLAVYYVAAPILTLFYPPYSMWKGDWVWLVTMISGPIWVFGFLIAGYIELKFRAFPYLIRRFLYVLELWIWAVLTWLGLLAVAYRA